MPIDYKRYPPHWEEIRTRILRRARHRCEWCQVPNYAYRFTYNGTERVIDGEDVQSVREMMVYLEDTPHTMTRIVLTIAHLDHDEYNWDVVDDRLVALCQRCHVRYDVQEKRRRRRVKKYRDSLFPL